MLSLIIDTSTECGYVAIFDGEHVVFQVLLPRGLNNSKYLLSEIQNGLNSLHITVKDLGYVAVGIGPGSYTGIRVGVMVAKSIAFACQTPLISFCSLEAYRSTSQEPFVAILDAKIGGGYLLKKGDKIPLLIKLEKMNDELKAYKILVTPNQSILKNKLDALFPFNSWMWEEKEPDVSYICNRAFESYQKEEFTDSAALELLYLRKTQAEIEKEQKY